MWMIRLWGTLEAPLGHLRGAHRWQLPPTPPYSLPMICAPPTHCVRTRSFKISFGEYEANDGVTITILNCCKDLSMFFADLTFVRSKRTFCNLNRSFEESFLPPAD